MSNVCLKILIVTAIGAAAKFEIEYSQLIRIN